MKNKQNTSASVAEYEFQVEINAKPARVWRALTDQLNAWWLPEFHMLGEDSSVTMEPKPGGRVYEQLGDEGLLWYTVLAISPNKSLSLAGYCTPEWGGPCSTLLTIKLTETDGRTLVCVSDALYGRVSDEQVTSLHSGWQKLFSDGLKQYVESA